MNIRAVTLMVGSVYKKDLNESLNIVENITSKFLEMVDSLKSENKVWTIRLALPYVSMEVRNLEKYAEVYEELAEKYSINFVSTLHFKSHDNRIWNIPQILKNNEKTFGSIVLESMEDVPYVSKVIEELDENSGYKLSAIWGEVVTPYFPAARAPIGVDGVSYTPFVVEEYLNRSFKEAESALLKTVKTTSEAIKVATEHLGLKFLGVDLSPSPWMDVSVAKVIEKIGGIRFGEYGTLHSIWMLNRSIANVSSKLNDRIIGFNEVMLAVAEDNVLKERAVERTYTIKDLVHYTFACVYGLDMVPVSKPLSYRKIAKILYDLKTASTIKGKPVGFRIIPVTAEPGSIIELGFFGNAPVFKL